MILRSLTTNERAETPGFTHVCVITANDLTNATVTATQAFTVAPIAKGDVMFRALGVPKVPFQNTADNTNNTTTVSVGDGGSATRHTAATEANLNGAYTPVVGNTPFLYAAADNLIVTFTPKTGTALNVLNRGEYHVFLSWCRSSFVSNAIAATAPSKP